MRSREGSDAAFIDILTGMGCLPLGPTLLSMHASSAPTLAERADTRFCATPCDSLFDARW